MITVFISDPAKRRWVLPAVSVLIAAGEVRTWRSPWGWQLAATLVIWAAAVGLWMLASARPHWAPIVGLAAASVVLVPVSHGVVAGLAMFGAVLQAGLRLPVRRGLPVAVATIVLYLAATVARSGLEPVSLGLSVLGWGALYSTGYAFRKLREEQARTREALEQLRLSRAAQVESAKLEERARLAREIHDVLAHTLSALSVQLEGARLLMEQRPGDPAALTAVDRAHRLARDGLVEARRAVGALRGGALPGPDALRALAADFEADTGVPCRVEVEGEPAPLSAEARLAVYRTAQEALTNVRKHARATSVTLRLRWTPDGAELTVEDEGERGEWGVRSGYGLLGVRERAELLGGTLDAGPLEHGFRVRLWVPA
jgi:signal transduction histidine kinase